MLEIPDNESVFAPTTASYPPTEIDSTVGANKEATTDKVVTDHDSTKQIAGPRRRKITAINYGSLTADQIGPLPVNGLVLMGFSMKENASGTAEVIIRQGGSAIADEVVDVDLNPNESVREWYGPDGIDVPNGIFIDWVSGTVKVTLYIAHE